MSSECPSPPRISPSPTLVPRLTLLLRLQPFVFCYTLDTFPTIRTRLTPLVAPRSSRPKTRGSPTSHRPTSNHERLPLHVAHVARNPLLIAPRSRPCRYEESPFLCIDSFRLPQGYPSCVSISFALDFCSSFYTFLFYSSLLPSYTAASAAPSRPLSRT